MNHIIKNNSNEIEDLKTEIVSLKIRLRRLEDFVGDFPNPESYLRNTNQDYSKEDKDLFDSACKIFLDSGAASASLLQRSLDIGYARAARIIEELEKKDLIGKAIDSQPREVFSERIEQYLDKTLK